MTIQKDCQLYLQSITGLPYSALEYDKQVKGHNQLIIFSVKGKTQKQTITNIKKKTKTRPKLIDFLGRVHAHFEFTQGEIIVRAYSPTRYTVEILHRGK